ncbi:MAG: hypothetical protein GBAus27B_000312 [Mycoplasmataceae bacterium]|nr:MAG: hypothetical protein GBAus27B_000312 [Mycoplasmataceae bacterium]
MGRKNFKELYKKMKQSQEKGKITCKIACSSDKFDSSKSYAGAIIYSLDGNFQWVSEGGLTKGHRGRGFYVIIFLSDRLASVSGDGVVHGKLINESLGMGINLNKVCCGGFSYHQNCLKFRSGTLNSANQIGWESDGSSDLSSSEKLIANYCFEQYKNHGASYVFDIPESIENQIVGEKYETYQEINNKSY